MAKGCRQVNSFLHRKRRLRMKNAWNKIPLASKIGFLLEMIALVVLLVLMGLGKQVPQLVFNIFLAGLVIVMLSNIYHRNHKE